MSSTQPPSDALDPPARMDQAATGDRNQMIGEANHSTVINRQIIHQTIYGRISENSAPPLVSEVKPLTQQEYRQHQVLLNKVRDYWVKGVLEKSLHARVLIELGLQERLDLVQQPFSGFAEFAETAGQALPEGTHATTVFDQMGAGRTLLILGEPGSGKTITLLKLAEDLLVRTETDLRQPIPVVLNLSSWARKTQTIAQWLVQELLEKYQVSVALGKIWVETEALILLLDGLDEVKAEQRNACVQALNQFMQTHGTTEVTICCRIRDYQALSDRLILRSAVCIQPLTPEQIDRYFEQAGEQLRALKIVLTQDEELQELATSPLMLSIMSLAYQGYRRVDIAQGGTAEKYRQRLLDTYIERMFQRHTQKYLRKQSQRRLIWLAKRMTAVSQTVFLIERLQPSWLSTRGQPTCHRLLLGFISGLISVVLLVLIFVVLGLLFHFFSLSIGFINGLVIGSLFVNFLGILLGCIGGLFFGLTIVFLGDIKLVETLKWSWQAATNSFYIGLVAGPSFGLFVMLISLLSNSLSGGDFSIALNINLSLGILFRTLTDILFRALIFSLFGGLLGGLLGGFRGPEIQLKSKPNQGIWRSAWNAIILGLIAGLVGGLVGGLIGGLIYGWDQKLTFGFTGLIVGLISGGLMGGGSASIRHVALHLILYSQGRIPWNYARFLDYAADRLFLQKVGGGYIFVHRMLLEHFAAMNLEQEQH